MSAGTRCFDLDSCLQVLRHGRGTITQDTNNIEYENMVNILDEKNTRGSPLFHIYPFHAERLQIECFVMLYRVQTTYQLHCTATAKPNPLVTQADVEVQIMTMYMYHQWLPLQVKNVGPNEEAHTGVNNDHVDGHSRSRCISTEKKSATNDHQS